VKKEFDWKQVQPSLRYYPRICLEGLGKLQKVTLKIWSWTENHGGKKATECVTYRHDNRGYSAAFFRLNTLGYNIYPA
jgi:hypothetical protein